MIHDQFKFSAVIPMAWPNMTARAPEKFLHFLRKIGIMRNINVLVGHAALLVVKKDSFIYADFGRYITPKGFGRTRSATTDPKLILHTIPKWSTEGELMNLNEVCDELERISKATHGEDALYASIMYNVDISKVLGAIKDFQIKGYVPYSGLKKSESNCARFVTTAIMTGLDKNSEIYKRFNNPTTISPTPFFNVVAGNLDGKYLVWKDGIGNWRKDKPSAARRDVLIKLSYSFRRKKAKLLPTDIKEGQLAEPRKPDIIPSQASYLGGIGEGAWHYLEKIDENHLKKVRYFADGHFEYENIYEVDAEWINQFENNSVEITHDTHFSWITLLNRETKKKQRFYARNSAHR
jgi:hypothetical protein